MEGRLTRREILEKVAAHELSPEAAVLALAAVDVRAEPREDGTQGSVAAIQVRAHHGALRVRGDTDVAEAAADGPAVVHRRGAILVVEFAREVEGGYGVVGDRDHGRGSRRGRKSRDGRGRGDDHPRGRADSRWIDVRMHPELRLELDVDAGRATVEGVVGAVRATVNAGSAHLDVTGPVTADIVSGALSATLAPTTSTSRLRVRNGSLRVLLARGSDVVVHLSSNGGRTEVVGAQLDESGSFVVGSGTAVLDVVAEHASVHVTVEA